MKLLLTMILIAAAQTTYAEEKCSPGPFVYSYGNGTLSAIYNNNEYDLKTDANKVFKFTRRGTRLSIGRDSYNCRVHYTAESWGSAQMSFNCRSGSERLYIALFSEIQKECVVGKLYTGDAAEVQKEVSNLLSRFPTKRNPNVQELDFVLIRHEGWVK